MAQFEPYLEKFNELQPDFVKKVQENHVIFDLLKTSAEMKSIAALDRARARLLFG